MLPPSLLSYGRYQDILANCGAIDSVIVGEPESTIVRLAGSHARPIPGPPPGLLREASL